MHNERQRGEVRTTSTLVCWHFLAPHAAVGVSRLCNAKAAEGMAGSRQAEGGRGCRDPGGGRRCTGNVYGFSQPIQQRMNELISGVRSDVAVKIFGDDVLIQSAARVQAVLAECQGSGRRKSPSRSAGLPVLAVKLNRQALSRYGIRVEDVESLVEIAVGGKSAGRLFEGDRCFDIVVRLPEHLRSDIEAIRPLPVPLPPIESQGKATPALWGNSPLAQIRYLPLSELAQIDLALGPI